MLPQKIVFPFSDVDGVTFSALIKTNIVLKNGKRSVMFTAVPNNISFDDVMAGIGHGAKCGERVALIQHEIYDLTEEKPKPYGFSVPRSFVEEK